MLFKLKHKIIAIVSIIILTTCCILAYYNVKADEPIELALPIIMYHSILKSKSGKYIVNPKSLESDLQYLKKNNYTTITITDLINYVYNGYDLPEKPIILTFDDGHYNNLTYVLPLLEKYDMVAVISIVGQYTDSYTKSNETNPNYSYLRWSDIQEIMKTNRIEFQNHTYSMHSITKNRNGCMKNRFEDTQTYSKILSEDISKLQNEFLINTSYTPNTFTYPFGAISNDSIPIIKELGFKASLSCQEGINLIKKEPNDLYLLKRFNRSNTITVQRILEKLSKNTS